MIKIDQSQSENFQNKKFAKKSADHGISCNLIGRICVPRLKKKIKCKFLKIIFPSSSFGLPYLSRCVITPFLTLTSPPWVSFLIVPPLLPGAISLLLYHSPVTFHLVSLTLVSVYLFTCLPHLHICLLTLTFCHSVDAIG